MGPNCIRILQWHLTKSSLLQVNASVKVDLVLKVVHKMVSLPLLILNYLESR